MKIVDQYRNFCYKLNCDVSAAAVRKHNRAMDNLFKLFIQIKEIDNKAFMLDLIQDPDPRVRLISASDCLKLDIYVEESLNVLDLLEHSRVDPWIKCDAHFTIELWNEGKLK